jgi:SAM-dependent methyltransferase/GNAT superfamily N-acetyltransferase
VSDPAYSIRLARADEVALLAALEDAAGELFDATEFGESLPDGTCPTAVLETAQREGMLWVAQAPNGDIVGFACARWLAGEPHLEELDVHPDHGRRGLGAKLVRAVIEFARARGAGGVTLSTFRDVPWNAPFYAGLGFHALAAAELTEPLRELVAIEARKGLPVEQRVVMRLGLRASDRFHLREQYRDAGNLEARIELHQRFSTNAVGWQRWLIEQIGALDGLDVLDVGCGPATLWRSQLPQLRRCRSLTLCDLSPGMAREAHRALGKNAQRVGFAAADAQALPFRDAAFACVLANQMLYHVPDRRRAIAEFARVLGPRGRLVVSTVGERHLAEVDALLRRHGLPDAALGSATSAPFTLENGGAQLTQEFGAVALRRYEDSLAVTEVEPLLAYLHSMLPLAPAVTDALRHEIAGEIGRNGAFRITKDSGVFVVQR